jgi:hypothetical protein
LIAETVGDEAVTEIVAEKEQLFRRQLGDRVWMLFKDGATDHEHEQIMAETRADFRQRSRLANSMARRLANHAVGLLADLSNEEIAELLHLAARHVDREQVFCEPCEHEWEADPTVKSYERIDYDVICVRERCSKCEAIRERLVDRDDPGFGEAAQALAESEDHHQGGK